MPSLWDLRRSWKLKADQIQQTANFHFATLGHKERDGQFTDERSLKVYVHRKLPKAELAQLQPKELIPPSTAIIGKSGESMGRLQTDVCTAPDQYEGFGIRAGHAIIGFDRDKGVCALSFFAGGKKYLLTNAHVVMDVEAEGRMGPVQLRDRSTGALHTIGQVVHATRLRANAAADSDLAVVEIDPVFKVDAFMRLDSSVPFERESFGTLRSMTTTEYSYNVGGEVFRAHRPEPVMGFAPVRVDGVIVNYKRCWLLHMSDGVGVPGHSGALLYRKIAGKMRACGLVFAGSQSNRTILAFPFEPIATRVEGALGADIA